MATINLLYKRRYDITDKIYIAIPTVGEVVDNEDDYYSMVAALTSMPIDMMVQLDEIGIDFTKITEYELFIMLFHGLQMQDTSMIFGDLDLSKFERAINEKTHDPVLVDPVNDIVIDRAVQNKIAETLRTIHHLEKDRRMPANEDAKVFMLERAKIKAKRRKRKKVSELEDLIIAMVNAEQYKYGFYETRDLTIYQFNESVRQVVSKIEYEHRMNGVYAGTISAKDLSQDDLNWLKRK